MNRFLRCCGLECIWLTLLSIVALSFLAFPLHSQPLPTASEPGRLEDRFNPTLEPLAQARNFQGLESTTPPEIAAQVKLVLSGVKITNSTVYSNADIREFYESLIGKTISLSQVFSIAAQITAKYGNDGYSISRVIVPPQELDPSGALIELQAVEGYISEVVWPEEVTQYRNFFSEYSERIKSQRPINVATLERYLLLANDLPGLSFQSIMKPSATNPQASILQITMKRDLRNTIISFDNHGTDANGPYQATIQTTINNPTRKHDQLKLGYVLAAPAQSGNRSELHYMYFDYGRVLNSEGLRLNFSGNISRGQPGTIALRALEYKTESLNFSVALSKPFIRTRSKNLTGTVAFDFKDSKSFNLGVLDNEDRLRILRGELAYDFADDNGGVNQLIATAYVGIEGLGSTSNGNPNASRIPGKTNFYKFTFEANRQKPLRNQYALKMRFFGQWTGVPLLSSQECGYGGQRFGRAYDPSTIVGDRCLLATVELTKIIKPLWGLKSLQVYGTADYGYIHNISAPLGTPNSDDASSLSMGLRFGKGNWSADFAVSAPLLHPKSISDTNDLSAFFKLNWQF